MRVHLPQGLLVHLNPSDFIGQGGEGRVFAQPPKAYKVYHDPSQAMCLDKMKELSVIAHPQVLTPEDPLFNHRGDVIGYSMPFVGGCIPLCRLFNRDYVDRHGLRGDDLIALIQDMASVLKCIHDDGFLVVDLNPLNVLVSQDHRSVYFIDTDSYATPSCPATAIMDSVRDPLIVNNIFEQGSDWFAFAVVTFQLLTGIHPFRGKHQHLRRFSQRLSAGISALHPDVILPPSARPIGQIPDALRRWYRDVFEGGFRRPPPTDFGATETSQIEQAKDTTTLEFDVTDQFTESIRTCAEGYGRTVVVTDDWIYVDGHRRGRTPDGHLEVVFSPRRWVPLILAWTLQDGLRVWDTETLSTRAFGLQADALVRAGHTAYILSLGRLLALEFIETPAGIHVGTKMVSQVHRFATEIYPGCMVQNVLNTRYFTCLSDAGAMHHRIPELDDYRVIDAAYVDHALVVLALRDDQYHHFLIRFAVHGNHYRLAHSPNVGLIPATLAVTRTGIVVYQDDDHHLCLIHTDPESQSRRRVSLENEGRFRLWSKSNRLGFVRGQEMGTVRLKPTG